MKEEVLEEIIQEQIREVIEEEKKEGFDQEREGLPLRRDSDIGG